MLPFLSPWQSTCQEWSRNWPTQRFPECIVTRRLSACTRVPHRDGNLMGGSGSETDEVVAEVKGFARAKNRTRNPEICGPVRYPLDYRFTPPQILTSIPCYVLHSVLRSMDSASIGRSATSLLQLFLLRVHLYKSNLNLLCHAMAIPRCRRATKPSFSALITPWHYIVRYKMPFYFKLWPGQYFYRNITCMTMSHVSLIGATPTIQIY